MFKNNVGQIIFAAGIDHRSGGIGSFRRGVYDQQVTGGLGFDGHRGFDFSENVVAHPHLLFLQGNLCLTLELVKGGLGILQLLEFVSGGQFAFVAFASGGYIKSHPNGGSLRTART